jgi:hypothetical protein
MHSPKSTNQRYERVGEHVSIFQRGRHWFVYFRRSGKPQRQSLHTASKKESRRKALAVERDLVTGGSVRLMKAPKIEEVIEEYISHLRALGRSPKTIAKYLYGFKLVLNLAHELGIDRIDQVNLAFIDKFRNTRMRHKNVKESLDAKRSEN